MFCRSAFPPGLCAHMTGTSLLVINKNTAKMLCCLIPGCDETPVLPVSVLYSSFIELYSPQ